MSAEIIVQFKGITDVAGKIQWENHGVKEADGQFGKCMDFTKGTYLISPLNQPLLNFGTDVDFTISVWVNAHTNSGYKAVITHNDGSTNAPKLSYTLKYSLTPYFQYYAGDFLQTEKEYKMGKWTHIAITREGNTYRFFQDGVLYAEKVLNGININFTNETVRRATIGGDTYQDNAWATDYFEDLTVIRGAALWKADFIPIKAPTELYKYLLKSNGNVYGFVNGTLQNLGSNITTSIIDSLDVGFKSIDTLPNMSYIRVQKNDIDKSVSIFTKMKPQEVKPSAFFNLGKGTLGAVYMKYELKEPNVIKFAVTNDDINYYAYNFTTNDWELVSELSNGTDINKYTSIPVAKWQEKIVDKNFKIAFYINEVDYKKACKILNNSVYFTSDIFRKLYPGNDHNVILNQLDKTIVDMHSAGTYYLTWVI